VKVGSRTVPYWEAGSAYLPYTRGHFALGVAAAGAGVAWSMEPPVDGGGGYVGGYRGSGDYSGGADYGGVDFGGFDDMGGGGGGQ